MINHPKNKLNVLSYNISSYVFFNQCSNLSSPRPLNFSTELSSSCATLKTKRWNKRDLWTACWLEIEVYLLMPCWAHLSIFLPLLWLLNPNNSARPSSWQFLPVFGHLILASEFVGWYLTLWVGWFLVKSGYGLKIGMIRSKIKSLEKMYTRRTRRVHIT